MKTYNLFPPNDSSGDAKTQPPLSAILYMGSGYCPREVNKWCPCIKTFLFNEPCAQGWSLDYRHVLNSGKYRISAINWSLLSNSEAITRGPVRVFYACGSFNITFNTLDDSIEKAHKICQWSQAERCCRDPRGQDHKPKWSWHIEELLWKKPKSINKCSA